MNLMHTTKCLAKIYLVLLPTVNLQIPVPMPVPYPVGPQLFALPPPPPVQVPFPVGVPYPVGVPMPYKVTEKTTTTTTTTPSPAEAQQEKEDENIYIAVPAPYPVPVPIYPPAPPPPPPAPLLPPGCFHNSVHIPPMPPPMYAPPPPAIPMMPYQVMRPPVIVVPFPPPKQLFIRPSENKNSRYRPRESKYGSRESNSEDCSDSEGSRSYYDSESGSNSDRSSKESSKSESSRSKSSKKKSKKRKKLGHSLKKPKSRSRRNQPVFSNYVYSEEEDDRIRQTTDEDGADSQLFVNKVRIPAIPAKRFGSKRNMENRRLIPKTSNVEINKAAQELQQKFVKFKASQNTLDAGKKEIIFKSPEGKKISNLTVSLHID